MTSQPTRRLYPGLGRPIEYDNSQSDWSTRDDLIYYPIAARGEGSGSGNSHDILTVREVAMMFVMDRLTDKPDWHKKVFDDTIAAKWRAEALAWPDDDLWARATRGKGSRYYGIQQPGDKVKAECTIENILNDECFDFILGELRKKAQYFEKSNLIPTLDVGPCVVKSDTLVPGDLHDDIREAFEVLKKDQSANPDWHPGTDEKVRNLIHPSMYPLVYNVSKGFRDEVVGVDGAIRKWAGKGDVIRNDVSPEEPMPERRRLGNEGAKDTWSNRFQWLPSNISFNDDGSVKFTSYVNGLHPDKYPDIYHALERLIEKAIPAWDQCVGRLHNYQYRGTGRSKTRIELKDYDDDIDENWLPTERPSAEFIAAFDKSQLEDYEEEEEEEEYGAEYLADQVWEHIRRPLQPLPTPNDFETVDYTPNPANRLFKEYRERGLQVIVKMASIELTPGGESADFPFGSWHVEGQMNERIVGTALFYSDCENITDSGLEFRAQTRGTYLNDDMDIGQEKYHWMEAIFGVELGGGGDPGIQNWGDVETKEGRLLAFPNIFQHRVRPFKLADPTKPGYRRFVALWLVDPSVRIISTANVPPQRQDWWLESIIGQNDKSSNTATKSKAPESVQDVEMEQETTSNIPPSKQSMQDMETKAPFLATKLRAKLPTELLLDVSQRLTDTQSLPMSEEEAKGFRAELMKERSTAMQEIESTWQSNTYFFCEH